MSLGPTTNKPTSTVDQNRRVQEQMRAETQRAKPEPAAALPAEQAQIQRVDATPELQEATRATVKGQEDAVRARIQATPEASSTNPADAPRRGLEGQEFVGKRSGKGRRTAAAEVPEEARMQLASLPPADQVMGTTGTGQPAGETLQDEAGKRSGRGTRVGELNTDQVAPSEVQSEAVLMAGRRSGKGTRVGNSEIDIPGIPRTEFA
jgi:hypothetical protein